MTLYRKTLSGWGLYPRASCLVQRPERYHQIELPENHGIARGLGRSYGDAALSTDQTVILMERLDRYLSFDPERGILKAEAGAKLEDILWVFVPRGWFLPVTPGTKFVTLGGSVACDIHGKNHHVDGTFSRFVLDLELILPDGSREKCSPEKNPQLFWATVGGMGLTGIITEVSLQLTKIETSCIRMRHYFASDLEGVFDILADKTREDKYSVAWIDCFSTGKQLGRGIIMHGHAAKKEEVSKDLRIHSDSSYKLPLPSLALNPWSVKAFNALYCAWNKRKLDPQTVHYDSFFYPLDKVKDWNLLYGKKGFIQYQFVVPLHRSLETIKEVLEKISKGPFYSYLGVLKRFGAQGQGLLSFPFEGHTLTLDIPISSPELFPFLDQLDALILKNGGRVYLAKDARMKPEIFRAMYPQFEEWLQIKKKIDPAWKMSSDLSRRLGMEDQ